VVIKLLDGCLTDSDFILCCLLVTLQSFTIGNKQFSVVNLKT